jgi:hypothetical protein
VIQQNTDATGAFGTSTTAISIASGGVVTFASAPIFSALTANRLVRTAADKSLSSFADGSSGQVLRSAGTAIPAWSTATYPGTATGTGTILRADGTNWAASTSTFADTYTANNLLYASSSNTVAGLATANSGVLVTSGAGVPSIGTDIPTAVTIGSAYVYRAGGTDIALADGGTAASLTASTGGIVYSGAAALAILAGDTSDTRKFVRTLSVGGVAQPPVWDTVTKTDVGLSNVENTALSTWAGTTNITTLGTITTAAWNAGGITASAASTFNASLASKNGSTSAGFVDLYEDSDNGTNYARLIGPASTGDVTITLPATTGTVALTADKLSAFAATTSAELAGVISDETGSGPLVFGTSPRITTSLLDSNGNTVLGLTATGSAVNYLQLANAATGNNPSLAATGSDTNIGITLTPKGTGGVGIGVTAPLARLDVNGDVLIRSGNALYLSFNTALNGAYLNSPALNQIGIATGGTGEKVRIDTSGNVGIGGTAARATTAGTAVLNIFDGTAPVGTLTNGISIYSSAGEGYMMDAAGNATLQTPHDRITNEWIFYSVNTRTGRVLRIDIERLLRRLDAEYGGGYVHESRKDH